MQHVIRTSKKSHLHRSAQIHGPPALHHRLLRERDRLKACFERLPDMGREKGGLVQNGILYWLDRFGPQIVGDQFYALLILLCTIYKD